MRLRILPPYRTAPVTALVVVLVAAFTLGVSADEGRDTFSDTYFSDVQAALKALSEEDYAAALPLLRKLAVRGDTGAQWQLGQLYEFGHGVEPDLEQAATWYRLAALQGLDTAEMSLDALEESEPAKAMPVENLRAWLEGLAQEDNVIAQAILADVYAAEAESPEAMATAAEWYLRAAQGGHIRSQREVGHCLFNGRGVAQDYEAAAQWYARAAEQGDSSSHVMLAVMAAQGTGVPLSYNTARHHARTAAEQGNPRGQALLGLFLSKGLGGEADPIEACVWLTLAVEQGDADTAPLLEDVRARLTAEQRAAADARVQTWKAAQGWGE